MSFPDLPIWLEPMHMRVSASCLKPFSVLNVQASQWDALQKKCEQRGLSAAAIAAFKNNYKQLEAGVTGLVGKS